MLALFNLGVEEFAVLLLLGAALLLAIAPVLLLIGLVAWQARLRGYSFAVWFLANLLSLNPLLVLVVLAVLPDARKRALRRQEMAELESRLAARDRLATPGPDLPVAPLSVGDQVTVAPPPLPSIGDEETRG
jgi:hypothetical protein